MFAACDNLTKIDVSSFDTSNVTNMEYMFCSCTNLTSLDLSGFDTSKVTSIDYMFSNQELKPLSVKEYREYMKECKKEAKAKGRKQK